MEFPLQFLGKLSEELQRKFPEELLEEFLEGLLVEVPQSPSRGIASEAPRTIHGAFLEELLDEHLEKLLEELLEEYPKKLLKELMKEIPEFPDKLVEHFPH